MSVKVVKFLLTDILFDSRDKREVALLRELGHEVIVLCSGDVSETIITEEGVTIKRIKKLEVTRQQHRIIRVFKIIKRYLFFRRILKSLKADCLSCHDITALFIGWVSTWGLSVTGRPKLVYDSHEYEAGLNSARSRISVWMTIYLEGFLVKRTAFNMMVNNTIADEVQKLHKLRERPVVIRNLPYHLEIDETVCMERRRELLASMNIDSGSQIFLLMYHGGLQRDRGIENLIKIVAEMTNVAAVILGNGEATYLNSLHDLVDEEQVSDRVLFQASVPVGILWQYVGAADAGLCILLNTCKNHFYALPNKLSENIQSETPVIGSNFPEIKRIIEGYNVGLICDPDDISDLIAAVEEMRSNKKQYKKFKMNLKKAKNDLCWEKEKQVLIEAYGSITD